jgi:ABC-type transport system involved in cytochrome c biogenesis permease subunit
MKRSMFSLVIFLAVSFLGAKSIPAATSDGLPDTASPGESMSLLPRNLGKAAVGIEDLGTFGSIAVLHDGRLKPLETFSRHLLLQWSGRSRYEGRPALALLAEILFAPERTGDYKIFRIDNPEVADALRITQDAHRRYSYRQLEPALHRLQALAARADSVEDAKRNLVEKEVLRTMSNVVTYLNLTRAVQYALPSPALTVHSPETRAALHLPPEDGTLPTFWQLMDRAPLLARVLEDIGNQPQEQRGPVANEVVRLSRVMYLESQSGQTSALKIFPDTGTSTAWGAPSEVISNPILLQYMRDEVADLAGMASAYRKGQGDEFIHLAQAYNKGVRQLAPVQFGKTRFKLEVAYEKVDPIFLALLAYWAALFACFFYFLTPRKWLYSTGWLLSLVAVALHVTAIVMRILIMRRPPVTSLFETFPFVAAISIVSALFLERRSREGIALLCASLLGVILLSIAGRYAADGDTLQMLVAVLNSNFWLSTHVICITTGYGACLLSGAIGHMRLIRTVFPAKSGDTLREIDRMVFGTLCFGLLFSFIGTVLGGIWADQSWGRFWGWDPKENGALLIVLWCAILLHAKHWGVVREKGLAVGTVLGAVIVSLAWLGVNLLNVGLHSYGFTNGAALKLFSYIGGELLFMILALAGIAWRNRPSTTPAPHR